MIQNSKYLLLNVAIPEIIFGLTSTSINYTDCYTHVPGGVRRFKIPGSAMQVLMNSCLDTFPSQSLSITLKMVLALSAGFKCALCALVWFIIWNIDLTNLTISDNSMYPFPSISYILKQEK